MAQTTHGDTEAQHPPAARDLMAKGGHHRTSGDLSELPVLVAEEQCDPWLRHSGAVSGLGPAAVRHLWRGPGEAHRPGDLKGQKNLPLTVLEVELEPDPHVHCP